MIDIKRQVGEIGVYNERLGVTACQQLFMPPDGARYIEWGFSDNSLRLISTETGKVHVWIPLLMIKIKTNNDIGDSYYTCMRICIQDLSVQPVSLMLALWSLVARIA